MQVNAGFSVRPAAAGAAIDPVLDQKLRKAANDYEAVFIGQMFSHMFEGLKSDGPMDGGPGEAMFRSLLTEQYAGAIAKRGGVGLAQPIYRELLKLQENASHGQ